MLLADPPQRLLDLPTQEHLLEGLVALLGQLGRDPRPRRAGPAEVDHDIAVDREQPGAQRAQLGIEAVGCLPSPEEGVLHRLLGQPGVLERAEREAIELAGVCRVGLAHAGFAGQETISHVRWDSIRAHPCCP